MTLKPTLIVKDINDLNKLQLMEADLLSTDPAYQLWEKRCEEIYRRAVESAQLEFRPYQYQSAALYCLRRDNLNSGSQGTGKTLASAVAVAAVYPDLATRRAGTVHVVVPNGLAAARWVEDFNRVEEIRDHYQVVTSTAQLKRASKPILIYNLDFLRNLMPKVAGLKRKVAAKYLYKYLRPSWLIVDEAHELGDGRSQRAKLLSILRRRAKRYMELSGTVSDGSVKGVYVFLKRIYRDDFPYRSYEHMKDFASNERVSTNYISGSIQTGRDRWVEGLKADKLPEYYALMRRFMHRTRLSDPHVSQYVTIPEEQLIVSKTVPSREMLLQYMHLVRQRQSQMELLAEAEDSVENRGASLRLIHPLIQLVNSPPYEMHSTKLDQTKEIINNAKGKVGIFVHHRNSGEYLMHQLAEYEPSYLHADLSPVERLQVLEDFQLGERKVTILSSNLASASIDLTAGSDTIFYCLSWKFLQLQQAAARMVRPGNKNPKVNIHFLSHVGLVDEHQLTLAQYRTIGSKLVNDFELMESDGTEVRVIDNQYSPLSALRQIMQTLSVLQ